MGTTKWFFISVNSFMCHQITCWLNFSWHNSRLVYLIEDSFINFNLLDSRCSFHTLDSWRVLAWSLCGHTLTWFLDQCGFFHESLNYLPVWISWHTWNSWMVYPLCEFVNQSLNYLPVWISCHTWSSWMVSHQYGFFHGFSNYLMWWILSHTLSS